MRTQLQNYSLLLFSLLLMLSCEKQDLPPSEAQLVYPLNNETCQDGESVNATQSSLVMEWDASRGASGYRLVVTNLITNSETRYETQDTSYEVVLTKSEPYSWYVESKGAGIYVPSETWRFYLANTSVVNYAPFPAELVTPTSGASIYLDLSKSTQLVWLANDVDNDVSFFEVYFDTVDATTLYRTIERTADRRNVLAVTLEKNKIYYWRVLTFDSAGNESDSGVYTFSVVN